MNNTNTPWYVLTRLDICPHCGGTTWAQDPHNSHRYIKCQHCQQGVIRRQIAATDADVDEALNRLHGGSPC